MSGVDASHMCDWNCGTIDKFNISSSIMPNLSQKQTQINLIRQRKLGKKMEKAQWFIGKSINKKTFYVGEHKSKENKKK